jgi:hypothetical protein
MIARQLTIFVWCSAICYLLTPAAQANCVVHCEAGSSINEDGTSGPPRCQAQIQATDLTDAYNQCSRKCPGGMVMGGNCGGGAAAPVTDLIRVVGFRGGCVAVFQHAIHFSPDCKDLRVGDAGKTVKIYDNDYSHIRGMAYYKNCIITAFDDGTIHRSCGDKLNLASDDKVYDGRILVYALYTRANEVCASFVENHGCYCDPDGENFVGGRPGDHHC